MKKLSINDRVHLQRELSLVIEHGADRVKQYLALKKKEYSISSTEKYLILISATTEEIEDYYNHCPELPK